MTYPTNPGDMGSTSPIPLDWRTLDPRDVLDVAQDELPLSESEARYAAASRSPHTLRGYRTDWREWCAWCEPVNVAPLPASPAHLARFISELADAGAKTGTISRKLSALRYAHKLVGLDDPTASARVSTVWEGIRRSIARAGGRQAITEKAPPLMPPRLWDVLDACPQRTTWTTRDNEASLAGARDRALLLVGFFSALRRSELARLDVAHLHADPRGYVIELPWSKTSQYGTTSDLIALPRTANPDRCPVRAVDAWLSLANITEGAVLRSVTKGNRPGGRLSEAGVNQLVIGAVQRAGLASPQADATSLQVPYSAHSLRAGFVTYAHLRGASPEQIAHQTRHSSLASVRGYTRIDTIWDDNAVTALGL